jgi:hypothetical protein
MPHTFFPQRIGNSIVKTRMPVPDWWLSSIIPATHGEEFRRTVD